MAQFSALGTTAAVAVTRRDRLPDATAAVQRTIAAFDLACSRFRPDSELMRVNAAGGAPVAVSSLLLEAVEAALRAARLTDGDVDPTVGKAVIALGYDRDYAELVAEQERAVPPLVSFAKVPGWQGVKLDRESGTIRLPRKVTLDLGATAKALAADRAAGAAAAAAECEVAVSLGGDIGTAGAPARGWQVRVTDDHAAGPEAPGQWITLHGGGLATSSTTARRWQTASGPVHHLVDPATGRPVEGPWRTVTVAGATCLDANSASTAAVIRGVRAQEWLESLGLPSRLVGSDGHARHIAGWPPSGDDLA
ncbi:MAG: FAD:protein FMN transferase [Solirubrobacterales bacterium]|nr:FAD:protein FMN transferase [Solirubrobacterales bacterium]MBV8942200.1 FAD:protein FMN transferase [Solirubrobacterales bacterium]MBV9166016.1 FAD:protein FMN transferase [Solirubrobacterales bacterium]MBV9534643.1 FAD:protein FMN transferase [Solirubrobacterales bacterium]